MTLRDLSELLGVNEGVVSKWENGNMYHLKMMMVLLDKVMVKKERKKALSGCGVIKINNYIDNETNRQKKLWLNSTSS